MTMMGVGAHTPGQGKIASINAQRKFFSSAVLLKIFKGLFHEMDLAFDDICG